MLNFLVRPVLKRALRARKGRHRRTAVFPRMVAPVFDTTTRHTLVDGWYDLAILQPLDAYLAARRPVAASDCLDVGANVGFHALHYARTFRTVYAFEPNPFSYQLLCINLRYSGRSNVEAINAALASESRRLSLVEGDAWNSGQCYLVAPGTADAPETTVEAWGPDEVERLLGATDRAVAYVKIDVEGAEPAVLDALAPLLRRHRPIVGFEVHGRADWQAIAGRLEVMGFRPETLFDAARNREMSVSRLRDGFHPLLCSDLREA
jgi:FkbM family methyltransferase